MKNYSHRLVISALFFFLSSLSASAAEPLKLHAAGSLKAALSEVAVSFENTYKTKVVTKFGPSGLLTTAIADGETADVFASANMAHPENSQPMDGEVLWCCLPVISFVPWPSLIYRQRRIICWTR